AAEGAADHAPEAADRSEAVHHRGGLVAAADHAIGALGIAAGRPVLLPPGGLEQLLEGLGVAVLQQVAGTLPAEDVVGGGAPGRALVMALAHQELEEERRHVELPAPFAVGED